MTSLISEIAKILNNTDTDFPERLKFADNAFLSPTLPMRQKEIFLLKWILSSSDILNKSTLQLCLKWVTSTQIIDLYRSDLSADDLIELTKSLTNVLSTPKNYCKERHELLFNISTAFIENKIFQHHFKFNMEMYYLLLSTLINAIQEQNLLEAILTNEQLLPKSLPTEYKALNEILWSIVKSVVKYPNSESIFNAAVKFINRCIFKPNSDRINTTLNGIFSDSKRVNVDIFTILFVTNTTANNIDQQMYYKLLLDSYYKCTKNFSNIYKFIIILFKNVGIRFGEMIECRPIPSINSNFKEGIAILVQIFQIISQNKNDFDCKIGEISFNDFLKHFAEVRLKQTPCIETLQLSNIILKMNAALIHDLSDQLIIFLVLNNFDDMQVEYNNLFILLVETYFKLHRIPGLVHKLLAAPLDGPSKIAVRIVQDDSFRFHDEINKEIIKTPVLYNIQNTLSPEILESFSNCLVQLVSNQSINIFMTLLHKFDVAIKNLDTTIEEPKKIFILEIICTLLCQVLSNVRFADNTISDAIMIKFVNIMEQIKDGLQIFGTSLVGLKHEPHMMRAFLNTSFTWAELYMISEYYSIKKIIYCKKDANFSDSSTCNISYLHNYLTPEQWGLISERIINFGETPCKQLLHKLFLQKLKAMYLFEPEVNKDVLHSIQQTIISSLRIIWKLLLTDQFARDVILPTIDYQNKRALANYLILDIVKNQEKSSFFEWKVFHDIDFNKALVTNLLQEMGKLLRTKRKREDTGLNSNSTKLLKELLNDTLDEDRMIEIFVDCIAKEDLIQICYSEGLMTTYLALLKHMPISNFSNDLKVSIFFYLCALLQDVKAVTIDRSILTVLESVILSILQIIPLQIIGKIPITALITFVEQTFNRHNEIFEQILIIFVKNESYSPNLSTGLILLIKSAKAKKKYIDLCLITMETLIKHISSKKISLEHKALLESYHCDMSSNLIKLMADKKIESVDLYVYTLNNVINKGNTENMETLLSLLDPYFKHSIVHINDSSQISGILTLFASLVKNKSLLKIGDTDYTLSIWNTCKKIVITEKDDEMYSRLMILIFETISNELFQTLLDDISLSIKISIANDDESTINFELKRCTSILPCMFNGTKLAIWTKCLENILLLLTQYFSDKISNNALAQFLLNLQNCTKMNLTAVMLDLSFITVQNLLSNVKSIDDFIVSFPCAYSILDSLIKHRKLFVLERLPAYLQQYRHLLALLCKYSDVQNPDTDKYMGKYTEYAHSLEKLTTYIVSTGKHMSRISQYVIADFLKHYETITLHAAVKLHLNNCIFQLMSLCDSHAVAYLMRTLSTASTEMFKLLFETYRKYYKFTGKV